MSYPYIGIWINRSHGAVTGSTITLKERDGGLLTAFLALFVSAAGAACWKILSYALHQYRARQEFLDGLHHQQQAVFRNSDSPARASWQMIKLTWYWRSHATNYIARTAPLAGLALLSLMLFGVAGIFSSEVTKAPGNEILIRSQNCGYPNLTDPNPLSGQAAFLTMDLNDTLAATVYQRACYGNSEDLPQCGHLIQQQLPWTSDDNAPCPFSPKMCSSGDRTAYKMDSGLIDSHDDLGINAPRKGRVQYRKVTSCSPIQTKDYEKKINETDIKSPIFGDTLIQYFYGDTATANYSYQYNTHILFENNGYTLDSLYAYSESDNESTWYPIDELKRTDADVSLFLLAPNSVWYEAPVEDPFYLATTPTTVPNGHGENITFYKPDRYVNVLGCTDQYQYCNPTTGNCTELTGWAPLGNEILKIGLNDVQLRTALRLRMSSELLNTYFSVNSRGADALRASETVNNKLQVALPDNQWIVEVSTWFAVSLARLQQKTVQYATGPPYTSDGLEIVGPLNKEDEQMCKNQIVRSQGGTISFSVLGVSIILIVGTILMATSLAIDSLVGFMRRKFRWKEYKSLQWTLDEQLQLQRLAYEEAGQGHWSGCAGSVPVTEKDERIGIPSPVDGAHPRLSRACGKPELTASGSEEASEAEALMTGKQMGYKEEEMHAQTAQ